MNEKRYFLEVRNFGPIIQADIELRPLSIFIGPSNTGKSWMAILIYALHQYFASFDKNKTVGPSKSNERFFEYESNQKKIESIALELRDVLDFFWGSDTNDGKPNLMEDRSLIELLKPIFDENGDQLKLELCRCFGTNAKDFISRISKTNPEVTIRRTSFSDREKYDFMYQIMPCKGSLESIFSKDFKFEGEEEADPDELDELINLLARFLDSAKKTKRGEGRLLKYLTSQVVLAFQAELLGPFSKSAYYLPADRAGIMHALDVIVTSLIESSSTTGLAAHSPRKTPMLTGVMTDFINSLRWIDEGLSDSSEFDATLAIGLEKRILQGEVGVKRGEVTNHPSFTYQPYGWKDSISLKNASSMVSELAPIILYLRHIVLPNSVLLVEEPESHLHPAMQVEFIRQLANLVDSGLRVIVTTHSEYLMEEIANIVRRSSIDPKSRLKEVSESDVALNSNDIGVWLFRPKYRGTRILGSVVEEVPLDESGLYPTGFEDVAMALHNDWANISSEIDHFD